MITPDLIKRITDKFTNRANYDYFFNELNDPQWIVPLKKAGFFKTPPPPIKENGYISFPGWPESQYLLRMAGKAPEEVVAIVKDIPDSDNPWVGEDIANIALALPLKQSVKLLDRLQQSTTSPYQRRLTQTLIEVIVKWAQAGSYSAALSLAERLIVLEKDENEIAGHTFTEPKSRLDSFDYQQTVEKITPQLASGRPKSLELTIGLYCKLLKTAIEYRYHISENEDEDTIEDYSQIWRRDITKDRRSGAFDQPRQSLVTGLRMALDALLNRDDITDDEKVKILEAVVSNRYKVFVRIAEYVLRDHADKEPLKTLYTVVEKAADAVKDKEVILRGPEEDTWFDGRQNHITDDVRKLDNKSLIDKIKATPIDRSSVMGGSRFVGELADYFTEDMKRFMPLASQLQEIGLPVLSALVEAAEKSSREKPAKEEFTDIDLLLQTVHGALSEASERDGPYNEWIKASALRLLENLLAQHDGQEIIEPQSRATIQHIILTLTRDPEPTPEDDENRGEDMDAPTVSVNTVRGIAMHALMKYALWLYRNKEEVKTKPFKESFDAVFAELDYHLQTDNDPSLAIRAVYGQWFPWIDLLDSDWATQNVSKIFSADKYGEAAWDAYFSFCNAYDNLLPIIKPLLEQNVMTLVKEKADDARRLSMAWVNFAEHMMLYYLRGKLPLNDPVLKKFFEQAPIGLRQHAIEFVGRIAHENDSITNVVVTRMKKLWEARVAKISTMDAEDVRKNAPELVMFGRWFISPVFDEKWRVDNLLSALKLAKSVEPDFMVMAKLAEIVNRYVLECVQCLAELISGASSRERWVITSWDDNARAILAAALDGTNAAAKELAAEQINRLLSKGYYSFKDLIKP